MCLYFLFLVLYAFQQNKELSTLINFYAIVAVCYISVLPENVKKPKVCRGYSNGTMGQNELISNNDSIDSVTIEIYNSKKIKAQATGGVL